MLHDHLSHLWLQIKRINSEIYKKTFEEIVRNIDKMENECIPSVSLDKREVKFLLHLLVSQYNIVYYAPLIIQYVNCHK